MSRIRPFLLLAALALIPAAAQAQTTITACYVPKTGSVYRIKAADTPTACKTNHVEFSWQSGGTVYTRRTSTGVVIAPNDFEQTSVSCEAGEFVVGGGHATSPNAPVSVAASLPGASPAQTWFIDVRNLSSMNIEAWAYAICAKPAN